MKNMCGKVFFLLVCIITCSLMTTSLNCDFAGDIVSKDTFRLAMNRPEDSFYFKWIALIYTEVFDRLEIPLEISYFPLKRATAVLNSGIVHGEPARIYEYGEGLPHIIRVDEPIFSMKVVAYSAVKLNKELDGWNRLNGSKLRIEYPRGMKICEDNLVNRNPPLRLTTITETEQGILKLINKRTDLYIDDENSVVPVLNRKEIEMNTMIFEAGVMDSVPLYMYVHEGRRDLVPHLAKHIKDISEEGLVEKFRIEAMGK